MSIGQYNVQSAVAQVGAVQWAVLVDPGSGATGVCYHDAAKTGEKSRWFLADGSEEATIATTIQQPV